MTTFNYSVKDKEARTFDGTIDAETQSLAVKELQRQGYYVLSVREGRGSEKQTVNPARWLVRWFWNPIFAGSTVKDLALFFRQLATMERSGLSLSQALHSLETQGGNRRLRRIAAESFEHVQAGGKLSDAFARYPWMFPELHISLIRAGETGGMMEVMLTRIADFLDREHAIQQKIRLGTLYPKILVLAVIFIPSLKILLFDGLRPYLKQTLSQLVPILVGITVIWTVFRLITGIPAVRYGLDCVKLAIPKLGKTVRMLALSKFYRALSALSAAGVPISQGIKHASRAAGNSYITGRLSRASVMVEQGRPLSEALESTRVLPRMALDMIATGEQTGDIDGMLDKAAEYTENESEVGVIQSITIGGVLLLLAIALYIGMIIISFYQGYGKSLDVK